MQPGDTSDHARTSRDRLLCAVGADEHAERVVRAARRLAAVTGLRPVFAHIVPAAEAARGAVWQGRSLLRHAGARTGEMEVAVGDPAGELLRWTRQDDVAAAIVAARGFGPLKAALLGSVSRTLMMEAPVPVVVIPPAADPPFDEAPTGEPDELRWDAWQEVLTVPRPSVWTTALDEHLGVQVANRGTLPVVVLPGVLTDASPAA